MTIWGRGITLWTKTCLLVAAALSACPCYAQDTPEIITLDPLVVTASAQQPEAPELSPSTIDAISAETARPLDITTAREAFQIIPKSM